jgi:two-component system response regulator NreC
MGWIEGSNMVTKIVLLDDHHIVREALHKMLESEGDFHVVGEAGDGLEDIKIVEKLHPDILVCDLMIEGYVHEAMHAGARAYVLKESTAIELVRAIREVVIGRRYFRTPFSDRAIDAYIQRTEEATLDSYETLTGREREVLHLAAEGYTNTGIADKLIISRRTVEAYRANVMQKLGLHAQADMIRYAIQRGILLPNL